MVRACASSAADVQRDIFAENPRLDASVDEEPATARERLKTGDVANKKRGEGGCRRRLHECLSCIAHNRSVTLLGITTTVLCRRRNENVVGHIAG